MANYIIELNQSAFKANSAWLRDVAGSDACVIASDLISDLQFMHLAYF